MAHAQSVELEINGQTVVAQVKEFSTGTFGWHFGDKVTHEGGEQLVKCQVGLTVTAIGSKDAGHGVPRRPRRRDLRCVSGLAWTLGRASYPLGGVMRPLIDLWAQFLANEKLSPDRIEEHWAMELVRLCEALAAKRGPKVRPYHAKLESRRLVCETAMELGIDLPAIKAQGRVAMARSLLDAWNSAYAARHGSTLGTASAREAIRRNVVTRLSQG